MITLYGFGAGFGLPEISPLVTKRSRKAACPRQGEGQAAGLAEGQLPYIVDEAETIADSTFIRAHLEAKYGFDLTPRSACRRAQAWAFERMIEHHVYWRWSARAGSMATILPRAVAFLRRRAAASA